MRSRETQKEGEKREGERESRWSEKTGNFAGREVCLLKDRKMPRAKHVKRRRREELLSHSSGVLYYASDVEDEDDDDDDDDDEEEEAVHVCKAKGKERVRDSDVRDVVDAGGYDVAGVSPAQEKVAGDRQQQQQICGICLTEEAVERGILDCCDHPFCFGCIMEWAKVESRCPMCKQRFVTIFRPSLPGVPRSRPRTFRIPHRDQVLHPSLLTHPMLSIFP